jgi:tRNA nucleotidyltransferase (CCA-adding enzyme)
MIVLNIQKSMINNMKEIRKLLEENIPGKSSHEEVISFLESELGKKADIFLGGSFAKNTALKDFDIDIFVRFHKKVQVDLVEKVLEKKFKISRVHGSRDYFSMKYKGTEYEIVPVLKIDKPDDAENITDVSYFHVQWIKKHLKNPDEVKLAKIFAKSNEVYGAESYINGFSGYVLELLISHYGNFDKLVHAVSKWKPKIVIDPAKHYGSEKKVLRKLNKSKIESPLIIVDPVQKTRNASAAISKDKLGKFIEASRKYIESPDLSNFKKKKWSLNRIKRLAKQYDASFISLKITPLEGKPDLVYTKALMAFRFIKKQLEIHEFELISSDYKVDKSLFWFVVNPKKLAKFKKHQGPAVWSRKENREAFQEKNKDVFIEDGYYISMKKREFVEAKELVKELIKREEVTKRVKRIR